ncbi:MAG TPA: YceI family protein [Paludibacter sp.]|nr:YceI family protein [Paludibacter sp.]
MNTKLLVALLLPVLATILCAQEKLVTRTGHIWFYSHAPLEDIEAHSHQAAAIITSKGTIAVMVPIMSFEFKKALMQEHFNENYMESSKYSKATFNGNIKNIQEIDTKRNGIYNTTVEGELTIHNVTNPVKADGTVEVRDGKYFIKSTFKVRLKDYNIAIENRLVNNIAPIIDVNVDLKF